MYHLLLQVVLKDVIPPEAVPRCQTAWLRLEEPPRADWAARRATRFGEILPSGEVSDNTDLGVMRTFFDVSGLCDAEEAYIDLVDNPITLPLMSRLCGHGGTELHSNQTDGHVTSAGGGGRVVPPDINPDGYTVWHRKSTQSNNTFNPQPAHPSSAFKF